jgi:hypothetical protein
VNEDQEDKAFEVDPVAVDPVAERISGLENQVLSLSLIVARIIDHLDPARTSHTLNIEDLL